MYTGIVVVWALAECARKEARNIGGGVLRLDRVERDVQILRGLGRGGGKAGGGGRERIECNGMEASE